MVGVAIRWLASHSPVRRRYSCLLAALRVLAEEEVAAAERDDGLAALLVQAVLWELTFFELGHRRAPSA